MLILKSKSNSANWRWNMSSLAQWLISLISASLEEVAGRPA